MNVPDTAALESACQQGMLIVGAPLSASLAHPDLLHSGEAESIHLAIELEAEWLLVDDLGTRHTTQHNLTAANRSTAIKGTLGMIVTAAHDQALALKQAINLVYALRGRPDVWLAPALCDVVIRTLQRLC